MGLDAVRAPSDVCDCNRTELFGLYVEFAWLEDLLIKSVKRLQDLLVEVL
jgi:hypothetical protein